MKKLLAIIVLGLLWSGNAYSKTVELNKCAQSGFKFDSKQYEKSSYIVDVDKSIAQRIRIITKEEYVRLKKQHDDPATIIKPLLNIIEILDFQIDYSDKRFVKANRKIHPSLTVILEIDLAEKIVTSSFKEAPDQSTIFKCN